MFTCWQQLAAARSAGRRCSLDYVNGEHRSTKDDRSTNDD
jgi:hypothetical protein